MIDTISHAPVTDEALRTASSDDLRQVLRTKLEELAGGLGQTLAATPDDATLIAEVDRLEACQRATFRQHDPSLCPSWCAGEHLTTVSDWVAGGFHHDGQQYALLPEQQEAEQFLYASLERFQPNDGDYWTTTVHVSTNHDALSLTPAEAREYAQELYRLAALAEGRTAQPDTLPAAPGLVPLDWHLPWCEEHNDVCTTRTRLLATDELHVWAYMRASDLGDDGEVRLPTVTVCVGGQHADVDMDGDAALALAHRLVEAHRRGDAPEVLQGVDVVQRTQAGITVTDRLGLADSLAAVLEEIVADGPEMATWSADGPAAAQQTAVQGL